MVLQPPLFQHGAGPVAKRGVLGEEGLLQEKPVDLLQIVDAS